MGRLGSRVWVSASFQIFALTATGGCPRWEGKLSGGGYVQGRNILDSNEPIFELFRTSVSFTDQISL